MILINGSPAQLARKPGEWWRRRRSNAAMIQDFASLKKAILLCKSCEGKMPWRWQDRYGYRKLHDMHTEGNCDYCRTYQSCDLFHHVEEGYFRQWEEQTGILTRAREQAIAIRDKRRIKGLDL